MSYIRDLQLSASGDLQITGGDLQLVDDVSCIIQAVRCRLQFWQGEWFIDQNQGMPYFTTIFVKNANLSLIKSIFRRAIETAPGILSVTKCEVSLNAHTRVLTVTWQAIASTGETIAQSDNLIFPTSTQPVTVTVTS